MVLYGSFISKCAADIPPKNHVFIFLFSLYLHTASIKQNKCQQQQYEYSKKWILLTLSFPYFAVHMRCYYYYHGYYF